MDFAQPSLTHDLTLPLSSRTMVYPGDSSPVIRRVADILDGDPLTASEVTLNCHVGTHIDAPSHFLAEGLSLDELPLEAYHGPATVVEFPTLDQIEAEHLEARSIPERRHLLFKTRNSELLGRDRFVETYCFLSPAAALFLCSLEPRSVGFDYYSLDPCGSEDFPAHTTLARRGIPVYACLDLRRVRPGNYEFFGLPLRLEGAEASPVRAILLERRSRRTG